MRIKEKKVTTKTTTTTTVGDSPETSRARSRRIMQNFLLVWLHDNLDENNNEFQLSLTELRAIVYTLEYFSDPDQCIDYLTSIKDEKIFLIVSGKFAENVVSLIHQMPQLDTIFGFFDNNNQQQEWSKQWLKVEGIHSSIQTICASLKKGTLECDHNALPISFVPMGTLEATIPSEHNLDQLEPSYMYSMLFKEIVLEIEENDTKAVHELVTYCRNQGISESQLGSFEREYHQKSPLWCYTRDSFLYGMLNKALRSLDMEVMMKMGFFIRQLHRQLEQLHKEQLCPHKKKFIVYRGQGLTQSDFQRLRETKGRLISFNNFLSTSKRKDVATLFVRSPMYRNEDIVGVLFFITIDHSKISTSTTRYARIDQYSAIQGEKEILFTMHTVFRVGETTRAVKNNRLWEVQLTITDDSDLQLAALTDAIKDEVQGSTGWSRMGKLMLKMGLFDQAEELYNELLQNASDSNGRAHIYYMLGMLKNHQGNYSESVTFYEKSLAIQRQCFPEEGPSFVSTYNNSGQVYHNMGDYSKALEFCKKSLKIIEMSLPPNHPECASSYNNIGQVYNSMGEYSKALEYYKKAHKIREIYLPPTHPSLAFSYNNLGEVFNNMGEYSKALEYYKKSHKIRKISLPPTHPDLASSCHNIGGVYDNMGEYSNALEYFEKAYEIREKSLPSNHPSLANSYNNIGCVYSNLGEYSKALEYYKKAHKIREISLPPTHPSLAFSYNNLGEVFNNMGEYSKALEYYKKSHKIREISLPPTHPDLADSYLHFTACYEKMGDYMAALKSLKKAYEIQEKTFQEGNLAFASTFSLYGTAYKDLKKYSKALSYFEKCLKILEVALPEKHPDRAVTYSDIGDVHRLMGDYEKAVAFHQKAFNIQENVKCDPLDCATSYMDLGETYREMKDYSTALTYFEKGLKIREEKLAKNHPALAVIYHSMSKLYLSTEQYSMAMEYIQRTVNIGREKLPSTHPHLAEYRETFEEIRKKQ
ncbi:unnamed protein product [Rotaria socialis]